MFWFFIWIEYDEEKCMMECPTDCEMSKWTDWSQCSVSCGTGVQMRYRHVREYPENGGRQCPLLDTAGKVINICYWIDMILYRVSTKILSFSFIIYSDIWDISMNIEHNKTCITDDILNKYTIHRYKYIYYVHTPCKSWYNMVFSSNS